jgi:hypothetical protein
MQTLMVRMFQNNRQQIAISQNSTLFGAILIGGFVAI